MAAMKTVCPQHVNGVSTDGEECDDGNVLDNDGCDSNCTLTACGNGIITDGEACDDGNEEDGDGCDSNCRPSGCGNGVLTDDEDCDMECSKWGRMRYQLYADGVR